MEWLRRESRGEQPKWEAGEGKGKEMGNEGTWRKEDKEPAAAGRVTTIPLYGGGSSC